MRHPSNVVLSQFFQRKGIVPVLAVAALWAGVSSGAFAWGSSPASPQEPAAAADWIRAHARSAQLQSDNFEDLEFLREALGDRRIVQLGESSHGVAEFNRLKVRLVKFLHEKMGFEVIAFESPLYECYRSERLFTEQPLTLTLRNCLFAIWHTREVLPLFEYIRESKTTARPLIVAGMDVQQRGWGEHGRPEFLRDVVALADAEYARQVHALDIEFLRKSAEGSQAFNAYLHDEGPRLIAAYEKLRVFLDERRDALARLHQDPMAPAVARQTAYSLAQLVRHRTSDASPSGTRDQGMADNLDFLLEKLYPGKRIIVWAHNTHVRHAHEALSADSFRSMGSWLSERRRAQVYTIGLYMLQGRVASNSRRIYDVAGSKPESLESRLAAAPGEVLFLDFSRVERSAATRWMWEPTSTLDWGRNEEILVPRDQYDGVFLVRSVNPPRYSLTPTP